MSEKLPVSMVRKVNVVPVQRYIVPCHFCGKQDYEVIPPVLSGELKEWRVFCKFCKAMGPWGRSHKSAIMRWNGSRRGLKEAKRITNETVLGKGVGYE